MPAASILLKCACGAQMELALDGDDPTGEYHDRIRKDSREWQKRHENHTASASRKRPLGFHTSAVSGDRMDGEGAGEWQGMYAGPTDDDDD